MCLVNATCALPLEAGRLLSLRDVAGTKQFAPRPISLRARPNFV